MPDSTVTVTIPAWLLVGLIDCHDAATRAPCEYVAEARRYLNDARAKGVSNG